MVNKLSSISRNYINLTCDSSAKIFAETSDILTRMEGGEVEEEREKGRKNGEERAILA